MSYEEQLKLLFEENRALKEIIKNLESRIIELEDLLRKATINKNSGNSSKPPSTDMFKPKPNQSLRVPSGKKSGGQPGHKGFTLNMVDVADEVVELNPAHCCKCGCSLDTAESHFEDKRQEFDIPPTQVKVKEYRRNSKKCPNCGHHQDVDFPKDITNYTQYGHNVETIVTYLSVYQYISYQRLKKCLKHFFKLDISEGTITNILIRMADKSKPKYDEIKTTILQSKQVGSDETSVKVNGKKHWIWVWQTKNATYLEAMDNRGSQAIDSVFPDGLVNSILNTDRWAAQLKTLSAGFQMCISHLFRDLNYIEQVDKIDWATRLKALFIKGIELKELQSEYSKAHPLVMHLEQELDILLKEDPKKVTKD